MAARIVRSVSSSRAASASDTAMGGAGRGQRVRKRDRRACSFLLLSSHDRSDPTIDCDGASDACGAPTRRSAGRRAGIDGGAAPRATGSARSRAIDSDSRLVTPGSLFVAIPGLRADGHRILADAVRVAPWPWWPSGCPETPLDASIPLILVERRAGWRSPTSPTPSTTTRAAVLCVAGITGPTARPRPRRCSGTRGERQGSPPRRSRPSIAASGDGDRLQPLAADDTRGAGAAGRAGPDSRRRLHACGARDLVARARDASGRRRGLPRRRVHADHHGAPRAARQPRPIPRRQGAAARARVAATRRHRGARCR